MNAYPAPGQPMYQPPMAAPMVRYGGFGRRLVAIIIDAIIIYIPVVLIASALGLGDANAEGGSVSVNLGGGGVLLNIAVSVLYDVILLTLLNGRTIGKVLLGVRVVGANGERITFGKALVRSLMKIVSIYVLFLGCLWVIWDGRKQGWHDKVASTLVVRR